MSKRVASPPSLFRLAGVVTIVLALPIVPALVHGELFADWASAWRVDPPGRWRMAGAIALVLALDVVLPVPSGPLNTLAGAQLGAGLATLVCWVGMTAGAVIAFAATRRWGAAAAAWLVSEAQLANAREVSGTASAWLLLASRPVPVLAEATIILAGLIGVPWLRFVRFVAAGNLVVAFVYASVGHWASLGRWLAPALIASAVAPLLLAVLVRSAARRRRFG